MQCCEELCLNSGVVKNRDRGLEGMSRGKIRVQHKQIRSYGKLFGSRKQGI